MGFTGLEIGKSGLMAATTAINTVGHNIANANTTGYSRQAVSSCAGQATVTATIITGNGVNINGVSRTVNLYYLKMERMSSNSYSYYNEAESGYTTLEASFDELSDYDLSSALDNFWESISDLSADVTDDALRQQVITEADALCTSFRALSTDMTEMTQQLNEEVTQSVESINGITSQIAQINQEIMKAEAAGGVASDLRDQRDLLTTELSSIVDITVKEDSSGAYNIYNGNNALVYKDSSSELTTKKESIDGVVYNMPVFSKGNIAIESDGGSLGAQLDLRDEIIPSYQDELDSLAAGVIWQVNLVTCQGTGLSGFSSVTGTTNVIDPAVSLDKLDYGFTPEDGTYEITDGTFEMKVYNTDTQQEEILTIDINLDSNDSTPDTILYDEDNPTAENSLINMMQSSLDSVAPNSFNVSLDKNNQIVIESNTDLYTLGFGTDETGVLATLGLNTLFTGNDATTIGVNDAVANNTNLLSTGDSLCETGSETVVNLLELRTKSVMNHGNQTIEEYYQAISVRLGNESANTTSMCEYKYDLLNLTQEQSLSISGVSTDEEAAKLIAYQTAYEAAAKFISTVDECYQSILEM